MNDRSKFMETVGRVGTSLFAAVFLLVASGCDSLLEVNDPDVITPESLDSPIGLEVQYAGAIGDFIYAYSGGGAPGSLQDSFVSFNLLLSDEMFLSGTFPTREEVDQRDTQETNGTMLGVFSILHRARVSMESTADLLVEAGDSDRAAELLALNGFAYIAFGELWCSGVPFSRVSPDGELVFGDPLTTEQTFQAAVGFFDQAQGLTSAADVVNLAKIGKARALVNLGQHQQAAAEVAGISTDFGYMMTHSDNTNRQNNGLNEANAETRRHSIANEEGNGSVLSGGVGLAFREDPMAQVLLPWVIDPAGPFDQGDAVVAAGQANLLQYAIGIPLGPGASIGRNAPAPLATGVEARLIEAEAAIQGGNIAGGVAILNALRTANGVAAAAVPGSMRGAVDLLFHDRAIWLYGTGHRVGDMRRLMRQYGLAEAEVFPTGDYFKGGTYGTDVSLPIPAEEENNPNAAQCLSPTSTP